MDAFASARSGPGAKQPTHCECATMLLPADCPGAKQPTWLLTNGDSFKINGDWTRCCLTVNQKLTK